MEIIAYIIAPFVISGSIYYLSKIVLDSIWKGILTLLGNSGLLGNEGIQNAIYHLVSKG